MSVDDWESWPWYRQVEASCVTVVAGKSPLDLIEAWPGPPITRFADRAAAEEWARDYDATNHGFRTLVVFGSLDEQRSFVWELDGGYILSDGAALAVYGTAAVNYWNDVNCTPMFGYAVDGQLRRMFTTDDPSLPYGLGEVAHPLPEEAGLEWPTSDDFTADGRESALALQALLLGAPVADLAWLDRPDLIWCGTNQ